MKRSGHQSQTHTGKGDEGDSRVSNPPSRDKHQRFSRHDDGGDIDAMSEDSFPASDPPSTSGTTSGGPKEKRPTVDELLKRQKSGGERKRETG